MKLDERESGDVTVLTVTGEITLSAGGDVQLKDKIQSLILQHRTAVVVNNVPRGAAIARLGTPLLVRGPAPVQVVRIAASRVPRGKFTLQGAIFDPGTSGFRMSVTNAVVVTKE